MKRRVRGLLHRKWFGPLLALVLAVLPAAVIGALVIALMRLPTLGTQLTEQFAGAQSASDKLLRVVTMVYSLGALDYTGVIAGLPGMAVLTGVYLFVTLPILVSLSGYFLGFLRGKNPSALEVYGCFSARYPRALAGMLYMLLWTVLWSLLPLVVPAGLYIAGEKVNELLAQSTTLNVGMIAYAVEIALCLLGFVVFALVYVNRLLAYSLTPICLAAQPRLPAHRAVRLSRKLMRGSKWRLIALYASFLIYYLPAIIAAALLIALPYLAPLAGLTEILRSNIRLFLWIVVAANQLVIVYVAPYASACLRAFYIERKREALMDEEVTPDDFVSRPRKEKDAH